MHWKTLVLAALLATTALAASVSAPSAGAATTYIGGQLLESQGGTSILGGGSYRFIAFGTDAAFGVLWGNASHANTIYVVAIKTRYLGVGQVYNQAGALLASNHVVKVYTVYAAQLQNLVEFKDGDGDGVANYSRTYDPVAKNWTGYAFRGADTGYKLVNLSANWVPGDVARTNGTQWRTWAFNLTATNLAYYNATLNRTKLTGTLPLVRFTFHLNASLVQEANVSIPQWNITVNRVAGRDVVSNVARMSDLTLVSAKAVHYELKWDQLIEGWSYAPGDNAPRLLLEVGSLVANYVPTEVLTGWAIIHSLHDDGNATYDTDAGNRTVDNSTQAYTYPERFKSPNLDFGGAWTQIARFLWASNSTVDGVNRTVVGQIEGGWLFATLSEKGLAFGFVLLTGLSYYGGNQIAHDPTVTSDSIGELQLPSGGGPASGPVFPWGAAILSVVVIVAIVLVAFFALTRREKEPPSGLPPQNPPQP